MPHLLILLCNLRNQLKQNRFFIYLTFFMVLGLGGTQHPSLAAPNESLEDFFEQTTVSGTIDSSNAINEVFINVPTVGMLDINFSLMLEEAGFASRNTFGLYDTVSKNYFQIFGGEATPGSRLSATVTSHSQLLIGDLTYDLEGPLSFYLSRNLKQQSQTFFSNDIRNGVPQALMYQGQGEGLLFNDIDTFFTEDDYIIGFEDKDARQSDKDYNDMVILAQTVLRIPEPAEPEDFAPNNNVTIPEPSLLSGLGMMAMLALIRKRASQS
ncbi:hypothetical protein [Crocosphaera subtropica]|nr:hypothetical protein [Crocosphaera subtropica]